MLLKYAYPHDESYIQDDSEFSLLTSENVGTRFLYAFLADKGRDNQLITFRNFGDFIREYGTYSFKKHGQPAKQVYETLRSGGVVHGIRVTAKNALYANIIIYAKTKVINSVPHTDALGNQLYRHDDGTVNSEMGTDGVAITRNMIEIKLEKDSLTNLFNLETAESMLTPYYKETVDADGYKSFPLFIITPTGRGVYGNKLHFRFTPNLTMDIDSSYRNYNLESYVNDGGFLPLEETRPVSIDPEASEDGLVTYIETVAEDFSTNYRVYESEAHFELLLDEIEAVMGSDFNRRDVDVLFCKDRDGSSSYYLKQAEGSLDLSKSDGISLENGNDGDFVLTSPTRSDAIRDAYIEAFAGITDDAVNNVFEYPVDVFLDAGYPVAVKKALISLATNRDDAPCLVDLGVQPTAQSAMSTRDEQFNNDAFNVMFYTGSGKVKDEFNGKNITVTITNQLATMITEHDKNKGYHIPLAGLENGIVSPFIKGTMFPKVNDEITKDNLYRRRINFMDQFKGIAFFNMETTSQRKNSKLLFYHNVRIVYAMKRDLENLVKFKRYRFTNPKEIQGFLKEGQELIDNGYIRPGRVKAETKLKITQTEYEKKAGIVRWTVDVVLEDIVLYNIVTLRIV